MMKGEIGRVSRGALSAFLLLWAAPTWATHIRSCSDSCAIDCATAGYTEATCQTADPIGKHCLLEDSYDCTSSDTGVGLYQGADLVLKRGMKLNCPNNDCGDAITIKGTDSKISTEEGGIGTELGGTSGGFHWAINCGGYDNSVVERVHVTGGIVGISNCEDVFDNIVDGFDRQYLTVNRGINWTRKVNAGSAADEASGNLISDKVWSFTATGTGTKVIIEDNHIMTSNKSSIVFLKDSSAVYNQVRNNILHGSGDSGWSNYFYGVDPVIFSGPTTGAAATNDCSVDDHPGCADCISAGVCLDYVPQ